MENNTSIEAVTQEITETVTNSAKLIFSEKTLGALFQIGIAIIILIIGAIIIKSIMKFCKKALLRSKIDMALHTFFLNTIKIILWIIVLLSALDYLGIPPTTFLTMIGAAGVAIALALQNSLSNFAGGVLIMITKPFAKGDYIEDLTVAGMIDKIDLLYTTILTPDNKLISIPNGKLANSTIVNYSRESNRRVDINIGVDYSSDLNKVKDIMLALAETDNRVLQEPKPFVGVTSYGDSSINMVLRVWCNTADFWDLFFDLQFRLKPAFDEADISIPYPQMDVHMKK